MRASAIARALGLPLACLALLGTNSGCTLLSLCQPCGEEIVASHCSRSYPKECPEPGGEGCPCPGPNPAPTSCPREESCPAPCPPQQVTAPPPHVEIHQAPTVHVKAPAPQVVVETAPPVQPQAFQPQQAFMSPQYAAAPQPQGMMALAPMGGAFQSAPVGRARPGLTLDFIRVPIPILRLVAIPTTPEYAAVPIAAAPYFPAAPVAPQPYPVAAAPQPMIPQPVLPAPPMMAAPAPVAPVPVAVPQPVVQPAPVAVAPPPQAPTHTIVGIQGQAIVPVQGQAVVPVQGQAIVPLQGQTGLPLAPAPAPCEPVFTPQVATPAPQPLNPATVDAFCRQVDALKAALQAQGLCPPK
jgi:hypothetical protein